MIDLYYFPTPNTWKISIFLEETGLDYRIIMVNILEGDQFKSDFQKISPNGRIPAIIDHDICDENGQPLTIMESGAILVHLAEKTGQFYPAEPAKRAKVLEWLMWQMAGLGPMGGQANHFNAYCPEDLPYAKQRYVTEVARLWRVLDTQLRDNQWIANNEYSIADMACWGWITLHELQGQDLDATPHLKAWFERVGNRPAVQRAYAIGADIAATPGQISPEARDLLYGQVPAGTIEDSNL
ncbi:MAG: glutathione binding-like protein [Halioglobus sp.]